jgi:hypothetical protein
MKKARLGPSQIIFDNASDNNVLVTDPVIEDKELSAEARDALPASDFAVPGKRQLPVNDKSHAKLAWGMVAKTDGLTAQEKRTAYKRILARLKKFGVDTTNYKTKVAVGDAAEPEVSVGWPEELSLDDFRSCLRAELSEVMPNFSLSDVYPGLGIVSAWRNSYYDPQGNWQYDNRIYTVEYKISDTDDGDGDVDLVNITFGTPKVSMMTPKVMEDTIETSLPSEIIVLSDAAEIAEGKPLRFRLPGPRANFLNKNKRIYPLAVLQDAIERAQPSIKAGRMLSYCPHPKRVQLADGSTSFEPFTENRVAKIDAWFLDAKSGISFIDRTLIDGTEKAKAIAGSIRAKAAVATSMRATGSQRKTRYKGEEVYIADHLDLGGDDFVENPATESTFSQAQVLTDAVVSVLLDTAEAISDVELTKATPVVAAAPAPILSTAAAATATASPKPPDAQAIGQQPKTEATDMKRFKRDAAGTLVLDAEGTLDEGGNPIVVTNPAPPAPAGAASGSAITDSIAGADPVKPATVIPPTQATPMFDASEQEEIAGILKERRATRSKDAVKTFLDAVTAGEEATVPGTDRKVKLDLTRFDDSEHKLIADACANATPETVEQVLTGTIQMLDGVKAKSALAGRGYNAAQGGGLGSSVTIIEDGQTKSWKEPVAKICEAMDRFGMRTSGFKVNKALREANQPLIDSIIEGAMAVSHHRGYKTPLMDSAEAFLDDTTSLSALLQMPTIVPASAALITQVYWAMQWLQMVQGIGPAGFSGGPGTDAGFGENLRVPVETRGSGRRNLLTREGQPIQTITTKLSWLNFSAIWRKLGFELTTEAQVQLERGAAKYDALGRQMFNVSQTLSENLDLALAQEHFNASDEYQAAAVTGELAVWANRLTAGEMTALGYGASVVVGFKMQVTKTLNTVAYLQPIVEPRHLRVIQDDGSVTDATDKITNPIVVTVGGNALVRGLLDENGEIVNNPDDISGNDADYAVDFENGTFVFNNANVTVDSGHLPTAAYSYATNITWFDLTPSGSAADIAIFYDSLLRLIDRVGGTMGSSPRFRPPTEAVFTLNNANYVTNARQAANLFRPEGTAASVTGNKPNTFGSRGGPDGVGFLKVNTPLRSMDSRILLKPDGAVKYGIQYPFQIKGPIPNYYGTVVGSKVQLQPIGSQFWISEHNSVICTPVNFEKVGSAIVQHNHPFHTIKLVGTASF